MLASIKKKVKVTYKPSSEGSVLYHFGVLPFILLVLTLKKTMAGGNRRFLAAVGDDREKDMPCSLVSGIG